MNRDQDTIGILGNIGRCLGLASILLLALCGSSAAAQSRLARLGFLGSSPATRVQPYIDALRQGLTELGYVEGQNLTIEYRIAEGKFDMLPKLADELVRLKVDVIFAQAAPAIRAARQATREIPIVFEMLADPVSAGFVASLAKPGGNLTGVGGFAPELSGKRLELLKELVPRLSVVAIVGNPANPQFTHIIKETDGAATALDLRLHAVPIKDPASVEPALSSAIKARAEALSVIPDPMVSGELKTILSFAVRHRLPAIFGISGAVDNGALMSYAPSQAEMFRRGAYYIDRILKGVKPEELPVEHPTRFELKINLKAAKEIGLKIPSHVLARADRVIR